MYNQIGINTDFNNVEIRGLRLQEVNSEIELINELKTSKIVSFPNDTTNYKSGIYVGFNGKPLNLLDFMLNPYYRQYEFNGLATPKIELFLPRGINNITINKFVFNSQGTFNNSNWNIDIFPKYTYKIFNNSFESNIYPTLLEINSNTGFTSLPYQLIIGGIQDKKILNVSIDNFVYEYNKTYQLNIQYDEYNSNGEIFNSMSNIFIFETTNNKNDDINTLGSRINNTSNNTQFNINTFIDNDFNCVIIGSSTLNITITKL